MRVIRLSTFISYRNPDIFSEELSKVIMRYQELGCYVEIDHNVTTCDNYVQFTALVLGYGEEDEKEDDKGEWE